MGAGSSISTSVTSEEQRLSVQVKKQKHGDEKPAEETSIESLLSAEPSSEEEEQISYLLADGRFGIIKDLSSETLDCIASFK
mmetsp:Transcript_44796/g.71574  ORF Transcript_44796/g.71574 Transcript_44796/m.71574 type:complete len:82 (-) Transcript_44796:268-513(-)